MATRGAIGRMDADRQFIGVRHTRFSTPPKLGKTLWALYHGVFQKNLERMLTVLVDEHPGGWSSIIDANFELPSNYSDGVTHGPKCYCHGVASSMSGIVTMNMVVEHEYPWVYAFNSNTSEMIILYKNELALSVNVDQGQEPDWDIVACGQDFSRCTHPAARHFPELEGTPSGRMAAAAYVGFRPPDVHDVCAVIMGGMRFNLTGHTRGGNGNLHAMGVAVNADGSVVDQPPHLRMLGAPAAPPVPAAHEGQDIIIGRENIRIGGGYMPSEGVVWLIPPTKTVPTETKFIPRTIHPRL